LSGNGTNTELSMREAGCALLELIGTSFIISHSGSAVYTTLWSDQCPSLIAGNNNIEAGNTPFQNYVGNASTPAVGTAPARPYGLTTTAIHYVPPINSSSELHTVTVGNDTLGFRSCIRQVEPARKLPAISSVPYLMITGEASPHITYDHCTIEYLIQVGGNPDWIKLADVGIHGNGHFIYLEKNNLQVAEVVHQWIQNRTRV
jgi:hypothetical protein